MKLSRRALVQGMGIAALGMGTSGVAQAAAPERSVVLLFLSGGFNAIFSSADSFLGDGSFGVTASNVTDLGNGLVVDRGFAESLGPSVTSQMAMLGVNHGQSGHDGAQASFWMHATRSAPLLLASALPKGAPIAAAQVGSQGPAGHHIPVEGVSLQPINDLDAIIRTFQAQGPTEPNRTVAASAMDAAARCRSARINASRSSLESIDTSYGTLAATLRLPLNPYDLRTVASKYGVGGSAIRDLPSQLAAAELMLRVGTKVVTVVDQFVWDTHADFNGSYVRNLYASRLAGPLRTFLERVLTTPELDPIILLCSEFARSLPGSDHAGVTAINVFGRGIRPGTTGRLRADVTLPNAPGNEALWAFLSEALGATTKPFGANPYPNLLR